jgi:invasion protein IalB
MAGLGLLTFSLACTPAHSQEGSVTAMPPIEQQHSSGTPSPLASASAAPPQAPGADGPSAWVKLCDRSQLKGKDKHGNDLVKEVEACVTMTEQIHLDTGLAVLDVTLQQVRLDDHERHALSVTVPLGVAMATGATVTVLPTDLWLKVHRSETLDSSDEIRLSARTFRLAFSHCIQAGCIAEIELSPALIDFLKDNAGLLVHTVRTGAPLMQPVPLAGFALALEGAPTDTNRYLQTRAELMQAIAERQRHMAGGMKKRADEPERTPAGQ